MVPYYIQSKCSHSQVVVFFNPDNFKFYRLDHLFCTLQTQITYQMEAYKMNNYMELIVPMFDKHEHFLTGETGKVF